MWEKELNMALNFDLPHLSLYQLTIEENTAFYKGYFDIDEVADTFINVDNFTKGFITVNGFNIGRYWEIGPQKTLYIPASLLKCGRNEIVIFESDKLKGEPEIEFVDTPVLG